MRRLKTIASFWALIPMLSAGILSSGARAAGPSHDVIDMTGATVTVPVTVDRIAEQFPAHTVTDIMLGAGSRLVAIPQNVKTIPFLRRVFPAIADVPELFRGGTVNMEDLLARQPSLVSALGGGVAARPFQTAGLPAVVMSFGTMQDLTRSILISGDVYGGTATARARAFVEYYQQKVALIRSRTAALRPDQRPRVVHVSGYPPLVVDGGPTLIRDWITLAGGNDGAQGVDTVHVGIGIEQLLAWDPDVLIVQTPGGDQGVAAITGRAMLDSLAGLPGWQQLRAVQGGHVYMNPQGMYPWDRFGPEDALQIQWAAKTLHPDLFPDLDIRAETRKFYQTFFDTTVTDAELDQILGTTP